MDKKEILEVLKEMLADYETALTAKCSSDAFNKLLDQKKLAYGFCTWICRSIQFGWKFGIMDELQKDLQGSIQDDDFYYPTTLDFNEIEQIKQNSLMPRAKHLLRTIERLESELK